jgi:hypothetical protein
MIDGVMHLLSGSPSQDRYPSGARGKRHRRHVTQPDEAVVGAFIWRPWGTLSIGRCAVRPRGERVQGGPDTSQENTVKYMLIMRATDEAYASFRDVGFDEIVAAVGRFNQELISAGVLVAAEGLDDAEQGVVVDFSAEPPVVTDGPYGETKELFGGFYILDVASREEAVEWAKRAPMTGPGFKTEIRRVTSIDEMPQDNEWIQKERAWREATGQL